MITVARVISTEDGFAVVESNRKSACEGCHKNTEGGCGVCTLVGSDKTIRVRANNDIGAAVGDTVRIGTRTGRVLGYALFVFLVPILTALLGWWLGELLLGDAKFAAIFAAAGFLVCFVLLGLYSRLVVSRRCDAVILEIVGRVSEE